MNVKKIVSIILFLFISLISIQAYSSNNNSCTRIDSSFPDYSEHTINCGRTRANFPNCQEQLNKIEDLHCSISKKQYLLFLTSSCIDKENKNFDKANLRLGGTYLIEIQNSLKNLELENEILTDCYNKERAIALSLLEEQEKLKREKEEEIFKFINNSTNIKVALTAKWCWIKQDKEKSIREIYQERKYANKYAGMVDKKKLYDLQNNIREDDEISKNIELVLNTNKLKMGNCNDVRIKDFISCLDYLIGENIGQDPPDHCETDLYNNFSKINEMSNGN